MAGARLRRWPPALALWLALAGAAPEAALGCGLENPHSLALARGLLNVAFPKALYVSAAVWQAQEEGLIPRLQAAAPAPDFAQRPSLVAAASAPTQDRPAGYQALAATQASLRSGLAAAMAGHETPPMTMVLLGAVHWTRLTPQGPSLAMDAHASGPQVGDVVLVTDLPVVIALHDRRLDLDTALSLDLLKLYGPPEVVAKARAWLQRWLLAPRADAGT
jgi:hypothetical protein